MHGNSIVKNTCRPPW